jgi:hypothetical protein
MSERQFYPLDISGFKLLVEKFSFRRRIDAVHLHHTWRPNRAQYRGRDTILAMWRFHTQELGWEDIAQHVTIAPDGTIWTGRDWNQRPASASGFNGNDTVGPFMIEIVGDFDRGKDRFEGDQKAAALEVIATLQAHWDLPERSLRFHNTMSSKTCPGNAIIYEDLIKELKQVRARAKEAAPQAATRSLRPFDDRMLQIQKVLDGLSFGEVRGLEPADAELPEPGAGTEGARWIEAFESPGLEDGGKRSLGGKAQITPRMLSDLAPHMVNLNQGRLSRAGATTTDPGDVEAIFDQHLPAALEVAQQEKRPLRLIFYAHGGLVPEADGIEVAHKHVSWWKANGVYPIYFTWETGLIETLRSFLPFGGQRGLPGVETRGLADFTDRRIEELIHVPGEKVWGGMKRSAEQSVDPIPMVGGQPEPREGGGARYVAEKLVEFLQKHSAGSVPIELHAVGHSAGAIFHSWFLPAALDLGTGPFTSVHFLAPAITVNGFIRRLAERLRNNELGRTTIYTMKKAMELADNCGRVYRKSLLYLIHFALEPVREEPILGLEVSLRADRTLKQIFALDGQPSVIGEVVWSESPSEDGRSASRSISHGGFDDDVPTMDSVLRRILDVSDTAPIQSFAKFKPTDSRGLEADPWTAPSEREAELLALVQPLRGGGVTSVPSSAPSTPVTPVPFASSPFRPGASLAGSGRRRALCVGIDRYPADPLGGCVADARLWAETLVGLGFESPAMLLDEQATRAGILDSLERLVGEGRPGDVLVFQYAGHGTQLPDLDGDEVDDSLDEAFCPIDFGTGAFLIDDDVAQVFSRIPSGVNVTCFIDSCNSGTITRMVGGRQKLPAGPTVKARFLVATPALEQAHAAFRKQRGLTRSGARNEEQLREVTFSACQSFQVALESDGHGEFTRRATKALGAGIEGLTHAAFQQRVEAAFEPGGQRPFLHCADEARNRGLLQPLNGNRATAGNAGGPAVLGAGEPIADLLRALARIVQPGG